MDKWLDAYIKGVKDDITLVLSKNVKVNLTREEEQAIKKLHNDDDIVIR